MRVACIGVGGQGWSNLRDVSRIASVSSICDVDSVALSRAAKAYPDSAVHSSIASLFDSDIDFEAVVVSVADHAHAEAIRLATKRGLHCYCEKPLVHSLRDLVSLGEPSSRNVITCLGCQGVYSGRFRYLADLLRGIRASDVTELIVWTDRPGDFWNPSPARLSVCGASVDKVNWSGWLGSLSVVDFSPRLHPLGWRRSVKFGTGPIGDMGPHLLALPLVIFGIHSAARGRIVKSIRDAEDEHPRALILKATLLCGEGEIPCAWYHGVFAPQHDIFTRVRRAENGLLMKLLGSTIYIPEWNCANAFEMRDGIVKRLFDCARVEPDDNIFRVWVDGCSTGAKTPTDFEEFGSPLTRTLLDLIQMTL